MFPDPNSNDPGIAQAFHGWISAVVLFLAYMAALLILTWCWNRSLRPADRSGLLPGGLLLGGYGLLLLLLQWPHAWAQAAVITAGMIIGGLLARNVRPRGLWIPGIVLAALIGMGLHLSAVLFFMVAMVALLLGGERRSR